MKPAEHPPCSLPHPLVLLCSLSPPSQNNNKLYFLLHGTHPFFMSRLAVTLLDFLRPIFVNPCKPLKQAPPPPPDERHPYLPPARPQGVGQPARTRCWGPTWTRPGRCRWPRQPLQPCKRARSVHGRACKWARTRAWVCACVRMLSMPASLNRRQTWPL